MKKRILCALLCALSVPLNPAAYALGLASDNAICASAQKTDYETLYQHDIDMSVLSDYIYGGSKATSGKSCGYGYAKVPEEWTRHERPKELPLVGKAVVHIGDAGKEGRVCGRFYPGQPPENYHKRRIEELTAIGYDPVMGPVSVEEGNANKAFFVYTSSEFEVVAYNDEWVAVWDIGGVDTSRGVGNPCGGEQYAQYASWKPGVYFLPRKNCYILDINNQLDSAPEAVANGTATCTLLVKTTPDSEDYVKAGVYKTNQSFQVIDTTPINGHYKVYYRHGAYYVNSQYVNLKLANTKKPMVTYTAEADTASLDAVNIYESPDKNSTLAGTVKTGALVEIIQKDYNDTYSKVWFNSRECYIETNYLTNLQKTPSGSGIAQLGAPIGVIVIDSPWSAYGQLAYTSDGLQFMKDLGNVSMSNRDLEQKLFSANVCSKMEDRDWANVYKIQDYEYTPDPLYPDEIETGKVYTVLFDGDIRYIVQDDERYCTFNYYPGNGYNKATVANTQSIYVDMDKYDVLAYNINGNNYFKIRDIAKMLTGSCKSFDIQYDSATNSINMLSFFDYTEVGGELTKGDGATRTAYSSSAFLTYDGIPIKATCYNIDGNNYFKLRDITDALDCKVEWDNQNKLIKVITTLPAYDDPSEPVG